MYEDLILEPTKDDFTGGELMMFSGIIIYKSICDHYFQ